jgi:hypothetical protein
LKPAFFEAIKYLTKVPVPTPKQGVVLAFEQSPSIRRGSLGRVQKETASSAYNVQTRLQAVGSLKKIEVQNFTNVDVHNDSKPQSFLKS